MLPRKTYVCSIEYGLPGGSEYACVPLHEVWEDLVPQLHVRVSGAYTMFTLAYLSNTSLLNASSAIGHCKLHVRVSGALGFARRAFSNTHASRATSDLSFHDPRVNAYISLFAFAAC